MSVEVMQAFLQYNSIGVGCSVVLILYLRKSRPRGLPVTGGSEVPPASKPIPLLLDADILELRQES